MICARKGCKNELQSPIRGPAKYCKDPVCVQERLRKFGRDYYWKAKKPPNIQPFVCAGCGFLIIPKDRKLRKYCQDSKCQAKRMAVNQDAHLARTPYVPREKKAKPPKQVKIVKEKPITTAPKPKRVVKKSDGFDSGAKMRNCDRGTREGFKRYWEACPIHFAQLFWGVTVAAAWRSMERQKRLTFGKIGCRVELTRQDRTI